MHDFSYFMNSRTQIDIGILNFSNKLIIQDSNKN